MSEKVAQNPEPAIGQVWLLDHPSFRWAGELTIDRIDVEADEVRFNGNACSSLTALRGENPDWRCVGLATPHGRVMVGERRRGAVTGTPFTVVRVDGAHVVVQEPGGTGCALVASEVAHWPLISPPPSEPPRQAERREPAAGPDFCASCLRERDDAPQAMCSSPEWHRGAPQAWDTVTIGGVSFPAKVTRYEPKTEASKEAARRIGRTSGSWTVPASSPLCACGLPMPSGCVMCPGCAGERWGREVRDRKPAPYVTPEDLKTCLPAASFYAAAHQEHPRPGTVAWLVKRVAYECGITTGVVEVEEDTRNARVAVRVPRYVPAEVVRAAEKRIAEDMPATVGFGIFFKSWSIAPPDLTPLRSLGSAVARACMLAAEQGPGISRLSRPEVRPDAVACERWEDRWALP